MALRSSFHRQRKVGKLMDCEMDEAHQELADQLKYRMGRLSREGGNILACLMAGKDDRPLT